MPPSIRISVPVMKAPSSDANIAITPATLSGPAMGAPPDSRSVLRIGDNLPKSDQSGVFRQVRRRSVGDPALHTAWSHRDGTQTLLAVFESQCVSEGLDSSLTCGIRGPCTGARRPAEVELKFTTTALAVARRAGPVPGG